MKLVRLACLGSAVLLFGAGIAAAKDVPPAELEGLVKSGKVMEPKKLDEIALAKHPGGKIEEGEVERHRSGYVYEVEVIDADGTEWDLDIDASSGKVLKSERD